MQLDLVTLFSDPRLMLLGFDGDFARFVPMTRDSYERSIFADNRVQPAPGQAVRFPLDPLLDHLDKTGFKAPKINFIHHFAQSGSTLLARALDRPENLVIREPLHLRQLGVAFGAGVHGSLSADQRSVLAFSLSMLGKRFEPGSTLIVKGNVPIGLLADEIAELDPGQAGILLYFPLEDYCAAVLRTPNHQQWLGTVTEEIGLGLDPMVGDIANLTLAEKAAALWFSMIKRFERLLASNPQMRSLDANALFDTPAETIAEASKLLNAGIGADEASSIAGGALFATYSKNPDIPYDPALRIERREEARQRLSSELLEARKWAERRAERFGLSARLGSPLLGEGPALMTQ
ncbi:MAG TPA: hypothetical protein VFO45_01015 [Sphingomicrobium sp.]|nr:hypothetical protein [Sphingomicrobium sp.]